MPSTRTTRATARKPYSVESVRRALSHHELTGAVYLASPPSQGDLKWRVVLPGQPDALVLTLAQAWALCCGLAAGERRWKEATI